MVFNRELKYPLNRDHQLDNCYVCQFCGEIFEADRETNRPVRITLPFKDQKSADAVRKQLKDLGEKIGTELQPVYSSAKIGDKLKLQEEKPALVNN